MRVKLEEVCKRIYAGGDVPKDRYSEEKTEDYKVPIFANAEKDEGLYGYTDEAKEKELSITVAARGTIGYTVIRREPFLPVVRLITVVPDLEKVSERYLFYALKMCKPQSSGTSIPQLTVPDIKKNTLNLLDIAEQESIANRLDKLNGIIKLRTEVISKMDELIRARFVEMFGEGLKDDGKFNLKPISEIGQVVSGATPKTSRHEYWNGNNVWITPAELSDESFVIYDSERKLTYEGVDSCAVTLLPVGTVILSSRAPIGKVAIAGVEMYCNQGFKNIIPRNSVSSIYLYELLKMETEYLNSLGRGATFKEISKQIVENIRVKVPPIELQNKFATFVQQVDKSKFEVQKALDKAQLLFDSLMQKYFG